MWKSFKKHFDAVHFTIVVALVSVWGTAVAFADLVSVA